MNRRAAAIATGAAAAVAGTGVLALALHLGHGLDATAITGLPDAGPGSVKSGLASEPPLSGGAGLRAICINLRRRPCC